MLQRHLHVGFIHHAADADNRHLCQAFGTLRDIFVDQRRRIAVIDDRGTQQLAHGKVHVVEAALRQFLQQIERVGKANAGHFDLFRREAIADNKGVVRDALRHFMGDIQHRQRETGAVFTAAAPLVVALVGVRGKELLNQIGIGAVQLHAVEARLDGAVHRVAEFSDHHLDFIGGQRLRRGRAFARCGNGAGAHRRFAADQPRFHHAAAVVNLQDSRRALRFNRVGDAGKSGDLVVAVDADSAGKGGPFVIDKTGFDDNRTKRACARAIVLHELAGHRAVVKSRTGGHRRHDQTIF